MKFSLSKTLLVCLLSIAAGATHAQSAGFSNIITFGDSLTDNGNYPEHNTYKKYDGYKGYKANLYIGITNPVNLNGTYKGPLDTLFGVNYDNSYKSPNLKNNPYLAHQPELDGKPRDSRAIMWGQYFLSYAREQGLTQSPYLAPWRMLYNDQTAKADSKYSVNYAWASALSGKGCWNASYADHIWHSKGENCDAVSINNSVKPYMNEAFSEDNEHKIQVPALNTQVDIFLNDLRTGHQKVAVNDQTLYFIWVGGNDVANNFNKIMAGEDIGGSVKKLLYGMAYNNHTAIQKLIDNKNANPKNIYVFTLLNPGYTPRLVEEAEHGTVALFKQKLADLLAKIYNLGLKAAVAETNWKIKSTHPGTQVSIVDTYTWFDEMHGGKGPLKEKYKSVFPGKNYDTFCQETNLYNGPNAPKENCQGYMYWNDIHPTMAVEQIVAYRLLEQVKQNITTPVNFGNPYHLLNHASIDINQAHKVELNKLKSERAKLFKEVDDTLKLIRK